MVLRGEPVFMPKDKLPQMEEVRAREGLKFAAVIPIRYQGEVVGSVNVASHTLESVPEHMESTIEGLAGLVAQAVGRLRLQATLEES